MFRGKSGLPFNMAKRKFAMVYRKFVTSLLASNSSYETHLAASLKTGVWKVLMANCSWQYLLYEVFEYFDVSKLSQTSY